jgi:S1/P1 Nuclease
MHRSVAAFALLGLALTLPSPASAWDYPGHRIVGDIADIVLARDYPKAHAKMKTVLALEGPGGKITERTLRDAAIFADCAKKKPYCPETVTQEEKDYAKANPKHDKFHYTNFAVEQTTYKAGSPGTTYIDIVRMIDYAVAQLRKQNPPKKKKVKLTDREAVWLLAHLVGDIHQPLHTGAQFFTPDCTERTDPNNGKPWTETVGGNRIKLSPTVLSTDSLHYYWDAATVTHAMQAQSEQAFAKALAEKPPAGWETKGDASTWATQWVNEAHPLAGKAHAPNITPQKGAKPGNCTWAMSLDTPYQEWAAGLAKEQLAKAGYRLAALMAAIFPD